MTAKSLLCNPDQPLHQPAVCAPGRQEVVQRFRKNGRIYNLVMRDKVVIEDPYIMLVKAAAFAIQNNEPYMGRLVPRSVRDFFIKQEIVV
jgi:hypothetical protein